MRTGTRAAGRRGPTVVAAVAAAIALAGSAVPATAITSAGCFAQRLKAWGSLRKCQRQEEAKAVRGRSSDPAKCQATFDRKAEMLRAEAAAVAVPCRFRDNGDNTVSDFDTGLMWVRQVAFDGMPSPFILDADDTFTWQAAAETAAKLAGTSASGTTIIPVTGNGSYTDWRLPTIVELAGIVDPAAPGCRSGGACIDPIFSDTAPRDYWSATRSSNAPSPAAFIDFFNGLIEFSNPVADLHAREVRSAF
jgi:Protein of unknown function (DUF1566)